MIKWHERRYPDDFRGWRPLGLIRGNRYLVLESPDKRYQCIIHLEDNDVVSVLEARSGQAVYDNPINLRGARILFELSKALGETYDLR